MKQTKSTALYATPFSKAYWRDAAAELRDTRMLVFAALMIALRVALKSLGIPIAADLKINVAFFINAFGAMTFGPVVAILAAAVSDTLGCILFPTGAYFFPFIFIEIAGSLIFALFLYRAKVTATRVILSRFCIDFFVNIVMNAPIMWVYYKMVLGKSYTLFQLPRIIKNHRTGGAADPLPHGDDAPGTADGPALRPGRAPENEEAAGGFAGGAVRGGRGLRGRILCV